MAQGKLNENASRSVDRNYSNSSRQQENETILVVCPEFVSFGVTQNVYNVKINPHDFSRKSYPSTYILSYIIQNYDKLPDFLIFYHGDVNCEMSLKSLFQYNIKDMCLKNNRKYKTITIVLVLLLLLLLGGGGAAVPFLLKKKSKTPDNSGNMCTFAEMTILSGQSRLFHEYSKHLLLATAPLQENQDVLPLKNFDGLELVSYNNNERNNGVSSLYVDCTKTNVVGDYYNARELRIPFSVPYSGNANNLHTTEAHPDDDLTRPSPH